jgi:hypothetical protein
MTSVCCGSGGSLDVRCGKTWYYGMTKAITKIGNSQGIIFDVALMDLMHFNISDTVDVAAACLFYGHLR